jgi:serine/threonine-protein kinase
MICPSCQSTNEEGAEACFTCGKALFALTQGVVLGGRYEVLSPLGSGGMGRVYKARDNVLDQSVAIKVLRPEFTRDREMYRRFRSEIRLAHKVNHKNVCRIHEWGEADGLCFISMEYIDGVTLKDDLDERTLTVAQAYEMAHQIAQGLRAVHDHGIIHRDFKASNIMIDRQGVVKLMDFGIAKEMASDSSGITGSGVVGTPEYMSPEQGDGRRVDFRSDVYSLGCVVFELFAGRPPFRGETALVTLFKHQREAPDLDPRHFSQPLAQALRVALAKDPADRYESVDAFSRALKEAQAAETEPAERLLSPDTTTLPRYVPLGPPSSPRSPLYDQLWPWAAVALLAVGLVAIGTHLSWLTPARSADPQATSAPPATLAERIDRADPLFAPRDDDSEGAAQAPPTTLWSIHPPPTPSPSAPAVGASEGAAVATGTLTLLIVPEAEVTIDGASLGQVSMREVTLAEGRHEVRVLHPDYEPLQRRLTIRADTASKLVLDLAEKGIRKQQPD